MITQEEYNAISKYVDVIKQIITDRAISSLSIGYREEVLEKVAKKYGWFTCNCGAGIFTATSRVYNAYLEYKNTENKDERETVNKRNRKTNKTKQ